MFKRPKYFVLEAYSRGKENGTNTDFQSFLLSYYEKENGVEVNRAFIHFNQIAADKSRLLFDSDKEADKARLMNACEGNNYAVYINLLPKKWQAPHWLRKKIHLYMQHHFKWWQYSRINKLHIGIKDRYGKLFLYLAWKGHRAEIILDDIENFEPCVTI